MNIHRWLPFILFITTFIAIVEAYVLFHWTRFVKKQNFHKLTYQIPIAISIVSILISFIFNLNRLYSNEINLKFNLFLLFSSFWYLPKLIILPFLVIKDILAFFKYIYFLLRNKQNITKHSNIANVDFSKRSTIATLSWTLASVPFATAGVGLMRDTSLIRYNIVRLELPKFGIKQGEFTLVQISDIHSGSLLSTRLLEKTISAINDIRPDIVVITGDFVNFNIKELDIILPALNNLYPVYGTYGCLGNHDHYVGDKNLAEFSEKLARVGVRLLRNENVVINTGMGSVQLAGVDNTGMSNQNYADFPKALNGLSTDESIIMLCHEPNNWEKSMVEKLPIDLTLSGHTHGGQFGFNIFGRETSPAELVYKYWAGLYRQKDQYLYVNRGLGTTGPPFRVGVNPEITIFKIKASQQIV